MKQLLYSKEAGKFTKTVTEVPDDDTPQKRRVKALAEAEPGRIAVGLAVKSSEQKWEKEAYLNETE